MNKKEIVNLVSKNRRFFRDDFPEWLELNWEVYQHFEVEARRIINVGRDHYSARTIVEVMRHESTIREHGGGYKINDHRAPDLARVFVIANPMHVNFWEYRRADWGAFKTFISEALA